MRPAVAAAAATLLVVPAALRAQYVDVRVGDRVRVEAPTLSAARLTGIVTRTTPDTLVLEADRTGHAWAIASERVARLDLSLGSTPRGELVRTSVLAGLAAGAIIGVTAGLAEDPQECRVQSGERRCEDDVGEIFLGAGILALAGGAVGAIVGVLRPSEEWTRIDPPIRLAAARGDDGAWRLAMGLRLSF